MAELVSIEISEYPIDLAERPSVGPDRFPHIRMRIANGSPICDLSLDSLTATRIGERLMECARMSVSAGDDNEHRTKVHRVVSVEPVERVESVKSSELSESAEQLSLL